MGCAGKSSIQMQNIKCQINEEAFRPKKKKVNEEATGDFITPPTMNYIYRSRLLLLYEK